MEKEIPFSQEKRSKTGRLREAALRLQEFPLSRLPSDTEWNQATEELTRDDLEHLYKMAVGHQNRAKEAIGDGEFSDAVEEATAAILLWPKDADWVRKTIALVKPAPKSSHLVKEFLQQAAKRAGQRSQFKVAPWVWPVVILVLSFVVIIGGVLSVWTVASPAGSGSQTLGPRNLGTSFDTQGVKTNIQVVQSRLLIFPEATVAELSAWVTFPEHRVELWEGTVSVLDSQGKVLAHRDVTFRAASQGPLEAGQGLEVFQQFDAWPWFDSASTFQISTSRILAQEAHPQNRQEWPLLGIETLTAGYSLKVWLEDSQWSARFASKVHKLTLEFENTGLKPFSELQLALIWRDEKGQTLKTVRFQPVSPFRTALPPGGRLGWSQETVFDSEVFSWPEGAAPHPVLELSKWQ